MKYSAVILLLSLVLGCRGKDGVNGADSATGTLLFEGVTTENVTSIYVNSFSELDVANVYISLETDYQKFFQIKGPVNFNPGDTNPYYEIIISSSGSAIVNLRNVPIRSKYKVHILKPTRII